MNPHFTPQKRENKSDICQNQAMQLNRAELQKVGERSFEGKKFKVE